MPLKKRDYHTFGAAAAAFEVAAQHADRGDVFAFRNQLHPESIKVIEKALGRLKAIRKVMGTGPPSAKSLARQRRFREEYYVKRKGNVSTKELLKIYDKLDKEFGE